MAMKVTETILSEIKKQPKDQKKDLFWDLFLTTGRIDAYLLLKDYVDEKK